MYTSRVMVVGRDYREIGVLELFDKKALKRDQQLKNYITDGCHESLQLFHFRNSICISNMGRKSLFIFKTDFRNLGKVVNTFTDYESRT
ncbi:unnamed protein product [Timema podura]|uniref:Uncharacterized protein n=1 Tax=Timema podura TaxID=61482 RepID=A0ABN7PDX6_TIMPD|nr:unnamed protein product [Timema podura]